MSDCTLSVYNPSGYIMGLHELRHTTPFSQEYNFVTTPHVSIITRM